MSLHLPKRRKAKRSKKATTSEQQGLLTRNRPINQVNSLPSVKTVTTEPASEKRAKRRKGRKTLSPSSLTQAILTSLRSFGTFAAKLQASTFDRSLLFITLGLLGFGLLSVYSASASQTFQETGSLYGIVGKQALFAVLGLGVMTTLSRIPYQLYRRLALPFTWGVIGLLGLTLIMGDTANGSERWLNLGGIRFQPSELAKLAAVTVLAKALATKRINGNHYAYWSKAALNLFLVGLMAGLIYKQPNLSIALLISGVSVLMVFLGGFSLWFLGLGLPASAWLLWKQLKSAGNYQWTRIESWLNPWADPQNSGYNLIQSYYAIGSGGIFGKGFGQSVQKLYYLPFQHTDFIFAVICEELGLLGSGLVLALFVGLGYRGYRIAYRCQTPFGQFLAFGLTTLILLQATINICVATGLFPVTGVTLPLISYGGTSLVVTLAMIGVLLNISSEQQPDSSTTEGQGNRPASNSLETQSLQRQWV